jgi:RimJ/RimL family protein N-acetyltransferase
MLTSKNIELRLLEKQDLSRRVKWFNDPEISKYLVSDYPVSLAKTEAWFSKTILDSSKVHFSIIDKETSTLIGMTGLLQISSKHMNAQMYITIGEESFHGQRLPDEIIPLVLNYAFIELNLNKVYLWTIPCNVRGRKVYERNGFTKEAEMHEQMYCKGKFQTIIQHRVLKSEFLEAKS